jgi:hypothetical protein
MPSEPAPSASLVRSARAEIERLKRRGAVLEQRRAALLAQLSELDGELAGYARRAKLLAELAEIETQPAPTAARGRIAIKGAALRRVAGRLLWDAQRSDEINYREWFERVLAAGYAVSGKDPAASFLTNVRDSPAVVKGSRPGMYRLDAEAIPRLEQSMREATAELADLERSIDGAYSSSAPREQIDRLTGRRVELQQAMKKTAAQLQEVQSIFGEISELDKASLQAA